LQIFVTMKNFETIRKVCGENSRISETVIDEFLIYHAAFAYKLESAINKDFSHHMHTIKKFQPDWVNKLKAQIIAHKIFRENGFIKKLINHVELRRLSKEEMDFLDRQTRNPWKFSFSIITGKPAKDFFYMEDVFSGEQYTLFSPSITDTEKSQSTILWFNLISYNGSCWQTYGPIIPYKSFEPDDIFFFATELNPAIENDNNILADIEKDPVPYMMLLSGANYPLVFHKNDQTVQVYSEYDIETINTHKLHDTFISEYNNHVYRLTLKEWGEHPHFATAYFDEEKKILLLSALTDRGFQALVTNLNKYGYNFSDEPMVRVNPSMLTTIKDILKKDIKLNEYDHLFKKDISQASQDEIDKLNAFMAMILPDINAGRTPDIEMLATTAGIDIDTARGLVQNLLNNLKR